MRKRGLDGSVTLVRPTSATIALLALVLATGCSGPVEPSGGQTRREESSSSYGAPKGNGPLGAEKAATSEVVVEKSDSACKHIWATGEFDVTCLALKPRTRVIRIIGPPTPRALLKNPAPPPFECYSWGYIYYDKGLLKALTYNYPMVPADYPWGPQALDWIGLKKTSEPHDYGFVVGWGKDSRQLVCCGLVMETVTMLKSAAQITVRFDRRTLETPSR